MRREPDKLRIPARYGSVVVRDAFPDLHQRVLDVARALVIAEVFGDLFVRKLAAEPGIPPKEEGKQHDQPRGEIKKQARAGGHAVGRFSGGRLGRTSRVYSHRSVTFTLRG